MSLQMSKLQYQIRQLTQMVALDEKSRGGRADSDAASPAEDSPE
jgi:hypothetical protein